MNTPAGVAAEPAATRQRVRQSVGPQGIDLFSSPGAEAVIGRALAVARPATTRFERSAVTRDQYRLKDQSPMPPRFGARARVSEFSLTQPLEAGRLRCSAFIIR